MSTIDCKIALLLEKRTQAGFVWAGSIVMQIL
jgi:hypothetical protein